MWRRGSILVAIIVLLSGWVSQGFWTTASGLAGAGVPGRGAPDAGGLSSTVDGIISPAPIIGLAGADRSDGGALVRPGPFAATAACAGDVPVVRAPDAIHLATGSAGNRLGASRMSDGRKQAAHQHPPMVSQAGSAPYQAPPVQRAVEPEARTGVRLNDAVDMGFTFQPLQYQGKAMRIANDSGRPLSVSFHGPGCAAVRLNGQPVVEGQRYLMYSDVEIAGPDPVGVHVRLPAGRERDPAPEGVG